jgi:1-acyl-sn-glycerol-3-phosphate acyltransferase
MSIHPLHSPVYWVIGKALIGTLTRSMVPIKAYGKERVPREGGAVLAVNHSPTPTRR